jgi:hypothetical protein
LCFRRVESLLTAWIAQTKLANYVKHMLSGLARDRPDVLRRYGSSIADQLQLARAQSTGEQGPADTESETEGEEEEEEDEQPPAAAVAASSSSIGPLLASASPSLPSPASVSPSLAMLSSAAAAGAVMQITPPSPLLPPSRRVMQPIAMPSLDSPSLASPRRPPVPTSS